VTVVVTRAAAKQEYTVPTEGTNGASVAADPGNKYVQNNLRLLEESYRKGKSIE
jgi:hypothetical protein